MNAYIRCKGEKLCSNLGNGNEGLVLVPGANASMADVSLVQFKSRRFLV